MVNKGSKDWDQSDVSDDEEEVYGDPNDDVGSDDDADDDDTLAIDQGEGTGFARFLDSDDEDEEVSAESDNDTGDGNASEDGMASEGGESSLRTKIEKVPFSALIKARRKVAVEIDLDQSEPDEFESDRRDARQQAELKERREIEKRESKHAPTEMSSRKPVSRLRKVVETPSVERRDPRFSSLSASLPNKGIFQSSYEFLRQQQSNEVKELRAVLAKLKRQEANHAGPRAKSEVALRIRLEREKVEMALRREEGRENERRRREHEGEVVRRAKKAIDERVKQGGKRYFLKDSEKKQLVLQDKFQRLSEGGNGSGSSSARGGIQRAMQRRRKKNAARDRQMPLGGGSIGSITGFSDDAPEPKRKRLAAEGGRTGSMARSSTASADVQASLRQDAGRDKRRRGSRGHGKSQTGGPA